jgi:outer membrane protein assembly factor BamB
LVFAIVVLFVGINFMSCISGDFDNIKDVFRINENETASLFNTDWWPMFHHDLSHSGSSTSSAPNTNFTLWNYAAGSSVHSSPAIADGKVYFGSMDRKVYCLNAVTGTKIWEYTIGHPVSSSPAVYENMVYFGSNDIPGENGNNVYCLNATTGEKIWEYATGESYWGVYSSPAVADGKVYVGAGDHKVYCFDALTGIKLWDFITNGEICSSPAIANGKVYIGSQDGFVYCLNASTGAEIWAQVTGYLSTSSPSVVNGRLYIGSDELFCLNAETGTIIWDRQPSCFFSSPAVYNNMIYFCDIDNGVYCYSADYGWPIWQYETGQGDIGMWSSPAVADEKVYVGSRDGKVYCLDANTGEKIWDYLTGYYPMFSSPAVAVGRVYIGDMIGNVHCFGQENNPPYKPVIYGPHNGTTNVSYTFYTDPITDPEGDQLYCFWDWGDGNNSGWLGPYPSGQPIYTSYMWTKAGVYYILLKLKDDGGWESNWSEPHVITIVENQPPEKPIINGPAIGRVGVAYNFTVVMCDPDADQFYYLWDWGDGYSTGWIGPYDSGEVVTISHTWNKSGTYQIHVKAKNPYGEQSNSDPFDIQIVELKKSFIIGSFNNRSETEDLIIIYTNFLIIFPSDSLVYSRVTIVIAKNYRFGFFISSIFGGIFEATLLFENPPPLFYI